ncbi:MAG: hypothetical protein IJM47_07630, partial [Synergistaceae bacterium]|nr:hypothetical protein [Synergistaceae bacterium]
LQGYLEIKMPPRKKTVQQVRKEPEKQEPSQPEVSAARRPDDVISNIGPQAMALLAAGQSRENEVFFSEGA